MDIYIFDDKYEETYPADGVYDTICRICFEYRPIEETNIDGVCNKCNSANNRYYDE